MNSLMIFSCRRLRPLLLLIFFALSPAAFAESPVTLQGKGAIDFSADGPSSFVLAGTASHLGRYMCHGEIELVPGEEEGTLIGEGIAVFEAANGDLLVGVVTWEIDPHDVGHVGFSWRDSVEFSDGTVVPSTGRFAGKRPPGAIGRIEARFPSPSPPPDDSPNIIVILIVILFG